MGEQSIIANTAVALGGRFVQVSLGIFVIAVTSRFLGEAAFGIYSTLLAYGSLLLIGADFGLYLTLTREVGREPATTQSVLSDITWLRLASLTVAFAVGSLVIRYIPALQPFLVAFWLIALGLSAQSISQLFMGVFQARSVVWRATVGDLIGRCVQIFILIAAAVSLLRVERVTAITLAFTAGTCTALLIHRLLLPIAWRLTSPPLWEKVRTIVRESWPAAAILILNAVYFRIDTVMLSLWRPAVEVGLYSLAYRIIESALFLPAMFGGLLLPHLSKQTGVPRSLLEEALTATAWVGAGVALVLALLARPIIIALSGLPFVGAASLLAILCLALFAMFFGNLFGFTLVARGKQRALMRLYLGLVIFNIFGNLLFIPRYGAVAAAWTTVATEIIAATVAGFLVWRLTPFRLVLLSQFKTLRQKP